MRKWESRKGHGVKVVGGKEEIVVGYLFGERSP